MNHHKFLNKLAKDINEETIRQPISGIDWIINFFYNCLGYYLLFSIGMLLLS